MTTQKTSIAPWLSVHDGNAAVEFYKNAFGAEETYRLNDPEAGGVVVRLSVEGAEFWISGSATEEKNQNHDPLGGDTVRMVLIVADPESFFDKAVEAGAIEVFPVGEEHGWKLGRVVDPFGLHWEIGHQIEE
jgi:PhnB protein